MLDGTGDGWLYLLDGSLATAWRERTALQALHLAPVAGEERVWLASSTQPMVRRYGPKGRLELERGNLPLGGLDRALAWRDGLLATAPGAILRLDAAGNLAPGQGGFAFLVDLCRAKD